MKFLLTISLLFSFLIGYSQQSKTQYEIQMEKLFITLLEDYKVPPSDIYELLGKEGEEFVLTGKVGFLTGVIIYNQASKMYPSQIEAINNKYNKLNEQVKKIKTEEDYKREKKYTLKLEQQELLMKEQRYKEEIERKKKEIDWEIEVQKQKIKDENERLEQQKRETLQKEEQQKKEDYERLKRLEYIKSEREKYEFSNTDYGKLKENIKIDFSTWLQKNKFEKQIEYENRIKTTSITELKKITEKKITESKNKSTLILSAALQNYNAEKETFQLKLFEEYSKEFKSDPIYLNIPRDIAKLLNEKFVSEKASNGNPLVAHILDVSMIDGNWVPSKILIIFPNENTQLGYSDIYFHSEYWNLMHIIDRGNSQYIISYPANITSPKRGKLKNIYTQQKRTTLEKESFFYEWRKEIIGNTNLEFTPEKLEIDLSLKN